MWMPGFFDWLSCAWGQLAVSLLVASFFVRLLVARHRQFLARLPVPRSAPLWGSSCQPEEGASRDQGAALVAVKMKTGLLNGKPVK